MTNRMTEDTQVVVLLCAVLGKNKTHKPLTPTEYHKMVLWLQSHQLRPANLLDFDAMDDVAADTGVDSDRLTFLMNRSLELATTIQEWRKLGVWVISRSDDHYPTRYRNHLDIAPPLLYGIGPQKLLTGGGLAVVGSRDVDSKGEQFAQYVSQLSAQNGMKIVSGGARGVDQIAMLSALDAGGYVIGILADSLLKRSLQPVYRNAIASERLVLISPYHPHARFTVGGAMGRNKLIYAMANYGLVVSTAFNKGGTWAGAKEELRRKKHRPVFVRTDEYAPQDNQKLLEIGALSWPIQPSSTDLNAQLQTLASQEQTQENPEQLSLLGLVEDKSPKEIVPITTKTTDAVATDTVFHIVLPHILEQLENPISETELNTILGVRIGQLRDWLKRGVNEGAIIRLENPVRYRVGVSRTKENLSA